MAPDNPNDRVTRADLDRQLEVHTKTIELQILLSQQQEKILERLDTNQESCQKALDKIEIIERRTWKQNWLFWGLIGSMLTAATSIIIKLLGAG